MEEQLKILMEKLQSGVEHTPELYQALRTEYFVYKILDILASTMSGLCVLTIGALAFWLFFRSRYTEYAMGNVAIQRLKQLEAKRMKCLVTFIICVIVLNVICIGLQYVCAPDIVFLNKLK